MTIRIVRHLHSGIYRSHGGGEDRIVAEYTTGPRNLLKALDRADAEGAGNARAYGNIGCGTTWVEVDGVEITFDDEYELSQQLVADEMEAYLHCRMSTRPQSRTERARALIARIRARTVTLEG